VNRFVSWDEKTAEDSFSGFDFMEDRAAYLPRVKGAPVWDSIPGGGYEFFSSPPAPDWLWSLPILLSNGYRR